MDSISSVAREELLSLLSDYCREQLASNDGQRLEAMLLATAEARQLYVEYLDLHVALRKRAKKNVAANDSLSGAGQSLSTRTPMVRFLGRATQIALSSPILATLCIACLVYGSFGMLVWQMGQHKNGSFPRVVPSSGAVAKLIAAENCQWEQDGQSLSVGAPIAPGKLSLVSGTAEFEFADGARVILQGPAHFDPRQSGQCLLEHGKLVAHVPQRAVGFSVETPTATVVDLGTEFAVEVHDRETTDVEVINGKVELLTRATAGDDRPQKSIKLVAGAARRIEATAPRGGVVVREITPNSSRFIREVNTSGSRRLVVQGAIASSENGGYTAKALIDGSGMKGEKHATYHYTDADIVKPPYHMWMSAPEKVQNAFLLFDLGKPYRLESMKVWNFNDGRWQLHTAWGVKQADIYVSKSGKWDPLKEPAEWKLVVDDFKFSVASGTDDYDTPDVIGLDNVEARFVAIVIADHFGPDPRGAPGQENVGLSEVQFFGERAEPPKRAVDR